MLKALGNGPHIRRGGQLFKKYCMFLSPFSLDSMHFLILTEEKYIVKIRPIDFLTDQSFLRRYISYSDLFKGPVSGFVGCQRWTSEFKGIM